MNGRIDPLNPLRLKAFSVLFTFVDRECRYHVKCHKKIEVIFFSPEQDRVVVQKWININMGACLFLAD